jgi:hypothetical protein
MAGVSFPVSRSAGEALVVASPAARSQVVATLATLGIASSAFDDPYAAMADLCRRPLVFRAVILSLAGVYTEELEIISAIKRHFPQVEIWLTHTDGRYSSLAEAMRLGADGLLADDGLHRIAAPTAPPASTTPPRSGGISPTVQPPPREDRTISIDAEDESNGHSSHPSNSSHPSHHPMAAVHAEAEQRTASAVPASTPSGPSGDGAFGEPILTADELRALLQEQPPTSENGEKGDF